MVVLSECFEGVEELSEMKDCDDKIPKFPALPALSTLSREELEEMVQTFHHSLIGLRSEMVKALNLIQRMTNEDIKS